MSEELLLLERSLDEALAAAYPADWPGPGEGEIATEAWALSVELGWDFAGLPEPLGGLGEGVAPLVALARACGAHRMPIPLVETALARVLLAEAEIEQPADARVLTVSDGFERVPWGRYAELLVTPAGVFELAGAEIVPGTNLAGEARDDVRVAGSPVAEVGNVESLVALLRSAQIAGALGRALALTREHTATRTQFGRPLRSFQLVGAHLAEMTSQVAVVDALLADAVRAHDAGTPEPSTSSLAVVAARAATDVARSAHQCHGAIGVTREHQLHHFTRRLWAWRDEGGGERHWSRVLGERAHAGSSTDLWASTQPQLALS